MSLIIGIDATNLRQGGGRTHLIEILRIADPDSHRFSRIIVWASNDTLDLLENYAWLQKVNVPALRGGLLIRTIWQILSLTRQVIKSNCNILLVPGGSYFGNFHPVVTMSRNMLPFEWNEIARYKWTKFSLKLILLRISQIRSFKKSDGIIFLSQYAKSTVTSIAGRLPESVIIAHGLSDRFKFDPRPQKSIEDYSKIHPYRMLYVSTVDYYKHQWHVIDAIEKIRKHNNWNITIDLVGPAYQPALLRLKKVMSLKDPGGEWINYRGEIQFNQLHEIYKNADLGVFASSCENLPNTLLEMMAAGLPVACSAKGPMPEILRDSGLYFNPEDPIDIACILETLLKDQNLRKILSIKSFELSKNYTWSQTATKTFEFLNKINASCNNRTRVR